MGSLANRAVRRQWYEILEKGGKPPQEPGGLGKVELALRWKHNPERVFQLSPDMEKDDDFHAAPNVLRLCLVRARGLKVMDKNLFSRGGSSDPFVTFTCDGLTRKSTVKTIR